MLGGLPATSSFATNRVPSENQAAENQVTWIDAASAGRTVFVSSLQQLYV
jgi:hypothetical protein